MSPTAWYVARSAGVIAYLLLSSSVVLGLLMSARASLSWPRFAVENVHRFLAILTGCFLALHGLSLLADRVVPLGLAHAVVPFTSHYRPLGVGLGVVAAELLGAVAVANALRGRIPYGAWRRVHYLTFAVWALSTLHAVLAGTDRFDPWFTALFGGAVSAVAMAFAVRFRRPAAARVGA